MISVRISLPSIPAAALLTLVSGLATAQERGSTLANQNAALRVDISGMWLVQDPGSGSWTDFFENSSGPAPILPEIQKYSEESLARQRAGDVVNRASRAADCPQGNLPMLMASSPPLNIVQGREEILLGSESGRARFIYLDGRDHSIVKSRGYRPSGTGHSIARWDGDVLIIDTVGFAPRVCDSRFPIMRTPGGGLAKDTTHLEERFELLENGQVLSVTFAWEDATVFSKPFRYAYKYRKIPQGYPVENNDDSRDPAYEQRQLQSVTPPPQN